MIYSIYEGNFERLEVKLGRIKKKCLKYGCDFHYEVVGDEYRTVEFDGKKVNARFILVDAEGTTVINGWTFVASIEHKENGNIVRKNPSVDVDIPEKYFTCKPYCDHCKTRKAWKNTYLIQNEDGEFKQVGKSCLASYTHGLSAEVITSYMSLFDKLIEGYTSYNSGYKNYINIKEYLECVAESIKNFGYWKTDSDYPTKMRAKQYYDYYYTGDLFSGEREAVKEEIERYNVNPENQTKSVEDALQWISTQDDFTNEYIHNLKLICSKDYTEYRNLGLIASLFVAYNNAMKKNEEKQKEDQNEKESEYQGEVGDRLAVDVDYCKVLAVWEGYYGTTTLIKFVDTDGNVYVWKKSGVFDAEINSLKGTVKEHKEYKGVKQTVLTRCKVS